MAAQLRFSGLPAIPTSAYSSRYHTYAAHEQPRGQERTHALFCIQHIIGQGVETAQDI
jgi:hypothetical protein